MAYCPRCRHRMQRRRNPYYGVGLAVHPYTNNCLECGYVEFIREQASVVETKLPDGPARHTPWWKGFFKHPKP
ncbi:ribosomal protein S27AE [Leifsonia soli]|uniref:Ribosomal protein S27AE n=1 Tax=Leifsonia soli TaxID=582665 RepID=A0A852T5L0_9MICO|nr:ribosomal protein S27AE [Leifsonia soli]